MYRRKATVTVAPLSPGTEEIYTITETNINALVASPVSTPSGDPLIGGPLEVLYAVIR